MTIDSKWITNISGKEFVLFEGLLNLAHEQGLESVDTEILQFPNKDNGQTCITKATVKTSKGTFSGIGDASPSSVGKMIINHTIRMSSTRSIARALRIATNVGMTAFEELGGDDSNPGSYQNTGGGYNPKKITDKQKKMVWAVACQFLDADKSQMSKGDIAQWLEDTCKAHNLPALTELSTKEASTLIDIIKGIEA